MNRASASLRGQVRGCGTSPGVQRGKEPRLLCGWNMPPEASRWLMPSGGAQPQYRPCVPGLSAHGLGPPSQLVGSAQLLCFNLWLCWVSLAVHLRCLLALSVEVPSSQGSSPALNLLGRVFSWGLARSQRISSHHHLCLSLAHPHWPFPLLRTSLIPPFISSLTSGSPFGPRSLLWQSPGRRPGGRS